MFKRVLVAPGLSPMRRPFQGVPYQKRQQYLFSLMQVLKVKNTMKAGL
jgi:hypothetical protein